MAPNDCGGAAAPIAASVVATSLSSGNAVGCDTEGGEPRLTCYQCYRQFSGSQAYRPTSADAHRASEAGDAHFPKVHLCSEACCQDYLVEVSTLQTQRQSDGAALAAQLAQTERERDEVEASLAKLRVALLTGGKTEPGDAADVISDCPGQKPTEAADVDSVATAAEIAARMMHTEKESLARARSADAQEQHATTRDGSQIALARTDDARPGVAFDYLGVDFDSLL